MKGTSMHVPPLEPGRGPELGMEGLYWEASALYVPARSSQIQVEVECPYGMSWNPKLGALVNTDVCRYIPLLCGCTSD